MADERDRLISPMEPLVAPAPLESWERRVERLLFAIGARFLERDNEPTYSCHVCRDTGYTSREKADKFGDPCSVATPCTGDEVPCPTGIPVEGGLWARAMQPRRGESAPPSDIAEKYRRRLYTHPHGNELRAAVDRALARAEKADK